MQNLQLQACKWHSKSQRSSMHAQQLQMWTTNAEQQPSHTERNAHVAKAMQVSMSFTAPDSL